MAKIKMKRLKAIAASKIRSRKKSSKSAPMGNPPKKPKAAKKSGPKKSTKSTSKKPKAAKPVGASKSSGAGKGRKNRNVTLFGEKYFTKTPKAAGAGGGYDYELKPRYRIYTVKLGSGYGTTKKRLLLIDKRPKEKGKPGKLPIQKMTTAGTSKNGKAVIKVATVTSKYSKRTKKQVKTANSSRKANITRKKNERAMGIRSKPKGKAPSGGKGKKPSSKKGKGAGASM